MPLINEADSVDTYVEREAPCTYLSLREKGLYLEFLSALGLMFSMGISVRVPEGGTTVVLEKGKMR